MSSRPSQARTRRRSTSARRDEEKGPSFLLVIGLLMCGGLTLTYSSIRLRSPLPHVCQNRAIALEGLPHALTYSIRGGRPVQWLSTRTAGRNCPGTDHPGPVLITATFVGYKVLGLLGAVLATIGVFTPCFFILVLLLPYTTGWERWSR